MSDIIQADRDAAAAFAAQTSGAPIDDPDIQACIKGEMDGSTVVQHFARARRKEAWRIAAMVLAEFDAPHVIDVGRRIASAIEEGKHHG